MTTASDQKTITLLLSVHGDTDAFGNLFAALRLDRDSVEGLLRKADSFRQAQRLEPELYQMTYFDYRIDWFESGWEPPVRDATDQDRTDAGLLETIFDEEDYPEDGIQKIDPARIPANGTMRVDYAILYVFDALDTTRPGKINFEWRMGVKHTDAILSTTNLQEEQLREYLGRL
jgi:hypothetical protein